MKKIFKQPLVIDDRFVVELPAGAEILDIQMQGAQPMVWYVCDPEAADESCEICFFGTGHQLPYNIEAYKYIATIQLRGGALVFHAFVAPK